MLSEDPSSGLLMSKPQLLQFQTQSDLFTKQIKPEPEHPDQTSFTFYPNQTLISIYDGTQKCRNKSTSDILS